MPDSLHIPFSDLATDRLPSLPHVLVVLLDVSHSQVISFERLSDLIKKDVALSARIVSAANAAYYGGQSKFLTFERTLVLLGLDAIKTIAITASVQQFFSRFDAKNTLRLKRFWRDSLSCALIAKSLAKLTGYEFCDEAYLAGLMHNVGELIFSSNYAREFEALVDQAQSLEQLLELEAEHFGGNRYQAGAWLMSEWNLNPFIADAIQFQDARLEEMQGAHQLVKILYLAKLLVDLDGQAEHPAYLAGERLFDLSHELLAKLSHKARDDVAAAATSMDIDIGALDTPAADETQLLPADEAMQIELADRVRNIALLDGVRQQLTRSASEAEVMLTIQKSLSILFGVRRSFFFLLDAQLDALVGKAVHEADKALRELRIPMHSASMLARSLKAKQPFSNLRQDSSEPVSVVDQQLIKLARAQAILALPLVTDQHAIGVLVVGVNPASRAQFERQLRLFGMFAHEATSHLLAQRQRSAADEQRSEEDRAYYHAKAREIVHEVNNPLAIIKNYVHVLGTKLGEEHLARDDLQVIKEELDRAGNILLRLPGIARQQAWSAQTAADQTDINALIEELVSVFRASLFATRAVAVELDLDSAMEPVSRDGNALKQILTNLLKNAAEAFESSGVITINTQSLVNFNGKGYVEIVIQDNGPGIAPAVQEKLFTPVVSTKGGSHAGLGLTIVKSLIDEMDGFISCRSSGKSGTRFEILIPRVLHK